MSVANIVEKLGGDPNSKQPLRLWLRLLSCSMVIEKRIRHQLAEEFGTTLPRFDLMAALDRHPGGLTMSELSSSMLVSNGNITAIVERLVEEALVERRQDEADRRVLHVALTPRGRRRFVAMAAVHESWIDAMMADLTEGDLDGLLDGLHRLRVSVESNPIGRDRAAKSRIRTAKARQSRP
jgi:DNA-binding MarR family transcriptional regulator